MTETGRKEVSVQVLSRSEDKFPEVRTFGPKASVLGSFYCDEMYTRLGVSFRS